MTRPPAIGTIGGSADAPGRKDSHDGTAGIERARPAWREPMVWLAGALPLAVVVAAVLTIAIAGDAPRDRGDARVRRIAQVQLADFAPDRAAARLHLHGTLEADAARGELRLGIERPDDELVLALLHPVDEDADREVILRRRGNGFQGATTPWNAGQAWTLRLQPRDGRWRLGGRLAPHASRAALQPAVPR